MSDLKSDKYELAKHIAQFMEVHGSEEAASLLSRSLLGIVIRSEGYNAEFQHDLGRVLVQHTPIRITH